MRAVPSVGRIVWTDYWAFLGVVLILVGMVTYPAIVYLGIVPQARGVDPLMGEAGAPFFFWFALAAVGVGIPGLFWRISTIRSVFEQGVRVDGVVTSVWFYKDRGRADFQYSHEGTVYQGGNPLHKTARTKALWEGESVTLVVDPQRPTRAFIEHLYVDSQ